MKKNIPISLLITLFAASLLLSSAAYGQDAGATLHLIIEKDIFTIYVEAEQPTSLAGLGLRVSLGNGRFQTFRLEDDPVFDINFIPNNELPGYCLIYVNQSIQPAPTTPLICSTNSKILRNPRSTRADIFWYDFSQETQRTVEVLRSTESLKFCSSADVDCLVPWTPLPTPTPTFTPSPTPAPNLPLPPTVRDTPPPVMFDLTIFRDPISLVLYIDGQQPMVDLSRLGFEFSLDNRRDQIYLRDLPPLDTLVSRPLETPACLRLIQSGSESPLPRVCNGLQVTDVTLRESDIFWYGSESHAFLVLNGEDAVDFCGTTSDCTVTVGAPGLEPLTDHVTLYLEWNVDYLAAYVEDTGLINLYGLRITDDPDEPGNLLQQGAAFQSLRFDEIHGPVCFVLAKSGFQEALPRGCAANRRIIEYVSDDDVFWRENHVNRILYVFTGDIPIGGYCANSGRCERSIPQ